MMRKTLLSFMGIVTCNYLVASNVMATASESLPHAHSSLEETGPAITVTHNYAGLPSHYIQQKEENLWFVMERCATYSNRAAPEAYCGYMDQFSAYTSKVNKALDLLEDYATRKDSVDALNEFTKMRFCCGVEEFLWDFQDCAKISGWVVYATDKLNLETDEMIDHIIMTFAVGMATEQPFTSHMGIVRNPLYNGTAHKYLSVKLHMFAARAALMFDPKKLYMLNRPLPKMATLLRAAFPGKIQTDKIGCYVTLKTAAGEAVSTYSKSDVTEIDYVDDQGATQTIKKPDFLGVGGRHFSVIPLKILSERG